VLIADCSTTEKVAMMKTLTSLLLMLVMMMKMMASCTEGRAVVS